VQLIAADLVCVAHYDPTLRVAARVQGEALEQ
jgi:hypothetical protein